MVLFGGYARSRGEAGLTVIREEWTQIWRVGAQALYLAVHVLLAGGCATTHQQPVQGEVVRSVTFRGNSGYFGDVPDSVLREAMEQRQSSGMWWIDPVTRAETLDRKTLAKDAWRIETWYANNGFFDARFKGWDVTTVRKGNPAKQRPPVVKVVGYIGERNRSTVRKIDWGGLGPLRVNKRTGLETGFYSLLVKHAAIHKGDDFTLDALREVEDLTLTRLHDQGYGFAEVTSRVDAFPEERVVDVMVDVTRGPDCKFGKVTISGDFAIPRSLVMAQVEIKEGKAFKAKTMAATQRNLFGLGVFSVVNVVPDLSRREDKVIPVRLELSESKYKQVRVGGGFQLENGKQDLHGTVEFQHVNVFNQLWNFTAAARPGYAWITTLSDVVDDDGLAESTAEQSPTAEGDLKLTIPRFPAEDWQLENEIHLEYGVEEGYKFFSPEVGPFLSWQVNKSLNVGTGYRLRFFKYYDLEADAALGRGRFGLNFTNPYLLSYLSQRVTWNTKKDPFFPFNSEHIVFDMREAGGPFSGGFNYLHPDLDVRIYRPIRRFFGLFRPGAVAAFQLAGGVMLPYKSKLNPGGRDEVPFAERRVLGGSSTVRGWVRNHLGPYVCDEEAYDGDLDLGRPSDVLACAGRLGKPQVTDAITPIGGTVYMNASFELRKYFNAGSLEDMGFALFNDWGMVWNQLNDVQITHLVPSAGMGFRYASPIGAIRLDGAYRFDTEPMFTLEPPFQIHFGLSEAF